MCVVGRFYNRPGLVLPAGADAGDPIIREDLLQSGPLPVVHFEHPTDNVSGLSREDSQQAPWSLDDF